MKLCIIYNAAPKYREGIFKLLDSTYDCDWYFGRLHTDIKEMDVTQLKHVKYYKTLRWGNKMYWQRGILHLLFTSRYHMFLFLTESRNLTAYLFFALAYYFFHTKKVYIWTHGWYGKESNMEAKLKLWMFRHVDGIFTYGDRARQLLIDKGIPADKVFAIHNSLDYDKQLAIRKGIQVSNIYHDHFGNDYPTLIFIGRLTTVKRLDLLVDATALLRKQGEHYNVVFVGDGEARQSLEKQVDREGLTNNVWFYGACYDEQTNAELIYNADLCVAPGNVGLTAMHTMVFGCPVITHNDFKWQMPEFEAIKEGKTGDFITRDDASSLANTISNWFTEKQNNREIVRQDCFHEIDTRWTPQFQIEVIKKYLPHM